MAKVKVTTQEEVDKICGANPDIMALQDACFFLTKKRAEVASGSNAAWRIIQHASQYIDRQIETLLSAPAEISESEFEMLLERTYNNADRQA